jgi:hypothetical protein
MHLCCCVGDIVFVLEHVVELMNRIGDAALQTTCACALLNNGRHNVGAMLCRWQMTGVLMFTCVQSCATSSWKRVTCIVATGRPSV